MGQRPRRQLATKKSPALRVPARGKGEIFQVAHACLSAILETLDDLGEGKYLFHLTPPTGVVAPFVSNRIFEFCCFYHYHHSHDCIYGAVRRSDTHR